MPNTPTAAKGELGRSPGAPRILVLIPVYDHPHTLREVVERTLSVHPDVLVVDDGSRDPVAPLLTGLEITLIRHEVNRGKGAAILTGAGQAARRGMTHLITLDADAHLLQYN